MLFCCRLSMGALCITLLPHYGNSSCAILDVTFKTLLHLCSCLFLRVGTPRVFRSECVSLRSFILKPASHSILYKKGTVRVYDRKLGTIFSTYKLFFQRNIFLSKISNRLISPNGLKRLIASDFPAQEQHNTEDTALL